MVAMTNFTPGLELSRRFYAEALRPLLGRWSHAAARLGTGSDVLGFDDERSTDHGWGPQLVVLVDDQDLDDVRDAVDRGLPETFAGWPVRFGWDDTPVTHHVTVATLPGWLISQLGVDSTSGLGYEDWLLMPQQKLLEVTGGAVYNDYVGALTAVRAQLAWYPHDVWLWMLASQWRRIAQEEPFVGRTAEVGDQLGSRLVTARLARELMRLWFLMHETYWPYPKWFGSAFARLPDATRFGRTLEVALNASDEAAREDALAEAYKLAANRHNELDVTAKVDPEVRQFHSRPYRVLMADRFVDACIETLDGDELTQLPLVGAIDQVTDSTDLLAYVKRARRLGPLYRP